MLSVSLPRVNNAINDQAINDQNNLSCCIVMCDVDVSFAFCVTLVLSSCPLPSSDQQSINFKLLGAVSSCMGLVKERS